MSDKNTYPNLKKNPIEVAIFEIRHQFLDLDIDVAQFLQLSSLIKEKYPVNNSGFNRNVHIDELPNGKARARITSSSVTEVRFISVDKTKTLMINAKVFNLNITGRYVSWQECIAEFQFLWLTFNKFISKRQPFQIIGASVRFLNKFLFKEFENPTDYFNSVIYSEKQAIVGEVSSYLIRYVTERENKNVQINVTQGPEPKMGEDIPYLFDIDAIYKSPIPFRQLWEIYELLHQLKNETFFSNLTPKTLNLLS